MLQSLRGVLPMTQMCTMLGDVVRVLAKESALDKVIVVAVVVVELDDVVVLALVVVSCCDNRPAAKHQKKHLFLLLLLFPVEMIKWNSLCSIYYWLVDDDNFPPCLMSLLLASWPRRYSRSAKCQCLICWITDVSMHLPSPRYDLS